MGKKSKTQKNKQLESGLTKKALQNMLTDILQKCINSPGTGCSPKELWGSHLTIRVSLENLTKLQKSSVISTLNSRATALGKFVLWLDERGIDHGSCEVFSQPDMVDEFGLRATVDMKKSTAFLTVPKSAMIHNEILHGSVIGTLIQQDPMLSGMPNVALAAFLVFELCSENSTWQPYIQVLPRTFNNVLFFTVEDLELLHGSPALREACNLWKSIIRQYSYLHLLLLKHSDPQISKLAERFTFEDYRWAVSVVMTRENQIPSSNADCETNLALIPMLDMCNHCNATPTVDFDDSKEACVCYTPRDLSKGDEIRIFYGPRPNSDLVLHNGFYFAENVFDVFRLRLGISRNDPLWSLKNDVLMKLRLPDVMEYVVHGSPKAPVDNTLELYCRVFCGTREELETIVKSEVTDGLSFALQVEHGPFSEDTKRKADTFLKNRLELLLKAYKEPVEIDDDLLSKNKLNDRARAIIQLRRKEKLILKDAINFLQSSVESSLFNTVKGVKDIDI